MCDSLQTMVKHNKIFSSISAAIAVSLVVPCVSLASAASVKETAITSVRSFPKITQVKRDLLAEATSTNVDADSKWGGIESLKVPETQSVQERRRQETQEAFGAASRSNDRNQLQSAAVAPSIPVNPPDGQSVAALLSFAAQFVGKVPYRSGGTTPQGWDCSGFVQYVFANMGIALPRTSGQQATVGTPIASLAEAQPGDIIANAGHASIYVGNGMVINSQLSGTRYDAISYIFTGSYSIRRVL